MAVTETTDTTTIQDRIIKKFTTDLSATSNQTQDSTTWTCPAGTYSVTMLIVGGGGAGGGQFQGGGGGAGGVLYGNLAVVPETEYTINVGTGGLFSYGSYGISGANSSFGTNIAYGGGGGGAYPNTSGCCSKTGGSGGAPAANGGCTAKASIQTNFETLIGYGYSSGRPNAGAYYSAGGGGAGSAGFAKDGGNGYTCNITGTNVIYATGGGGAAYGVVCGNGGSSNVNGGKGARYGSGATQGTATTPSTGAGGGGCGNSTYLGSSGASGVVILQYNQPKIWVSVY